METAQAVLIVGDIWGSAPYASHVFNFLDQLRRVIDATSNPGVPFFNGWGQLVFAFSALMQFSNLFLFCYLF